MTSQSRGRSELSTRTDVKGTNSRPRNAYTCKNRANLKKRKSSALLNKILTKLVFLIRNQEQWDKYFEKQGKRVVSSVITAALIFFA